MNRQPFVAALRALRQTLLGPDAPVGRPLLARWPRVARYAAPVGLLAALGLFWITFAVESEWGLPAPIAVLFAAMTVAPLLALPRRPLLAWRLTVLALLVCTFNAPADQPWPWTPPLALGSVAVLAGVVARVDRPVLAWVVAISTVPVLTLVHPDNRPAVLALLGASAIVGDLIRRNRLSRRALAAQTEVSEREQERRAVLEERTRIARELHDVVAHHMSLIAVQAETAPYRLTDVPAPAAAEFVAIAASARDALTDMRRLLGVLRSETAGPQTAPQPDLTDLGTMVDAARRAGLPVTLDAELVDDDRVPAPVGLAAYRIVQEGLANAARHAPGAAVRVTVRVGPSRLGVRVQNARPAEAGSRPGEAGAGHGLTGMRERAASLGGTFTAGPLPDGGYAVTAELPYDAEGGDR
ncbi:two-component sensor histidine kinase [Micromonospora orduensis]|uniref:histidine kinase n=1 Tax=Micromonospora orduensis TaxID=1420891 RepID=A0A5C4QDZ1_9ACTN|nr:histidine kinase [Micromonospora orduensis]TNH21977.1 two-component sensor histidine kinase [Micromonospora orduensis]